MTQSLYVKSLDCHGALGLENGAIPDGQLSASTEWDAILSIPQGRLGSPRSWSARTNDVNQWYQVDLASKYTKLTGVGTQGRGDHPQWVQKYKLQYSNDGVNFQYYWEQGQAAEKVSKSTEKLIGSDLSFILTLLTDAVPVYLHPRSPDKMQMSNCKNQLALID